MATIDKQLEEQKLEREQAFKEAIDKNSTEEERDIWGKLQRILIHFRDNIFPEQFEIIKMKKLFSKEYEAEIRRLWLEHKSAKVYPLIQPIHDTFMANLYDNDLKPKILPMEDTDPELAEKAQNFFQWWVEMSETEQTQEIIRNEATLIWASYWVPWYTNINTEIDWKKETLFVPTLYPVSFFEMFYSIWARDFYKAPEKFRRRFMSFQDLELTYKILMDEKQDDWTTMRDNLETKKYAILDYWNPLSKADFTKIYDIDAYSQTFIENFNSANYTCNGIVYDNTFNVLDTSNFVEVVELYIRDQLMIMVNGYFVYKGKSPYFYWEDELLSYEGPFIEMTYEKWLWAYPRWIGHKIMPHQKQCNALFNSLWDAIYKHLNPMYTVIQWAIFDPLTWSSPTALKYKEWATVTINPWYPGALGKLDFTDYNIVQIALTMLNQLKDDAASICWVNSYIMWWDGKIERTRSWVESRVGTAKARLAPITASIGRFYSKLFYHWINLAVNSWATIAYIEDENGNYVIPISDINKKFKIICTADASVEQQRATKLEWLMNNIQNLTPFVQNEITQLGEIDKRSFLDSVLKTIWLPGFKAYDKESYTQYINDSYDIKELMVEREMQLQQKQQQAQPWQPEMQAEWQLEQPAPEEVQQGPAEEQLPTYTF